MVETTTSVTSNFNVAIITAIITASVTFLGLYFNNRANNTRLQIQLKHDTEKIKLQLHHEKIMKDREMKIFKLEEVYELIEEFRICRANIFRHFCNVMDNHIEIATPAKTISSYEREIEVFHRIKTILGLHFDQIKAEFDLVNKRAVAMRVIENNISEDYFEGGPNYSSLKDDYKNEMMNFHLKGKLCCSALVKLMKDL